MYFNLLTTLLNENLNGEYKHSSTQINAPNDVAEKVLKYSMVIPDSDIFNDPEDPSMGRELESHITILYGLHTKDYKDIVKLIGSEVKEISVVLGETSLFEAKDTNYEVLKISVVSKTLNGLHNIFSTLPNEDKHPEYQPHLTIAYLKKGAGKRYAGDKTFDGIKFTCNSIQFKSSNGDSNKIELGKKVEETKLKDFLDNEKPVENETSEILKSNPLQSWATWQ